MFFLYFIAIDMLNCTLYKTAIVQCEEVLTI